MDEPLTSNTPSSLNGRIVVCIGGRTGLIDRYRRLVEMNGARFTHHDGGQEDNHHRISYLIANADAVICQAGYVSHNAYWELKEACKRRRLPCIFLKSSGLSSFARSLDTLAAEPTFNGAARQTKNNEAPLSN